MRTDGLGIPRDKNKAHASLDAPLAPCAPPPPGSWVGTHPPWLRPPPPPMAQALPAGHRASRFWKGLAARPGLHCGWSILGCGPPTSADWTSNRPQRHRGWQESGDSLDTGAPSGPAAAQRPGAARLTGAPSGPAAAQWPGAARLPHLLLLAKHPCPPRRPTTEVPRAVGHAVPARLPGLRPRQPPGPTVPRQPWPSRTLLAHQFPVASHMPHGGSHVRHPPGEHGLQEQSSLSTPQSRPRHPGES